MSLPVALVCGVGWAIFQGQPSFSSSVGRAGAAAQMSLWCLHCFRCEFTALFGSYPDRSSGSVVPHGLVSVELWPNHCPDNALQLQAEWSGSPWWQIFWSENSGSLLTCPSSLRRQSKSQGLNHMLKCFARIDINVSFNLKSGQLSEVNGT